MPNEVVKFKNDFIDIVKMDKMSPFAMNIFMVIIHKVNGKQDQSVEISYDMLRRLGKDTHKTTNLELKKIMDLQIFDIVGKTILKFDDTSGVSHILPLFQEVKNDMNKGVVSYCINEKMTDYFNDFISNFTVVELPEYTSLKSKYSKLLYTRLKQYRKRGFYTSEYEKFCYDVLSIPKGIAKRNINYKIIEPAIRELKQFECFKELEVTYNKRGKSIAAIFFHWKPEGEKRFVPPGVGDIPIDSMIDPYQREEREKLDAEWEQTLKQLESDSSFNNPFVSKVESKEESKNLDAIDLPDDDLPF